MRRLLSLGLLILVTASLPRSAHSQDSDADGVPDATDNCDAWSNPGQADVDANGIGDDCECGDQDGNGRVDVRDLIAINLAIFEPAQATALCDTDENDLCNVSDILGANFKIFGRPAYCSRDPSPEVPEVDDDGDGFSTDEGDCNDADAGVYPGAPVVTGTLDARNLAQGSCFAAREPDGTSPWDGGDGCSGINVEGVLDANNPTGCPGADFGSGDPANPDDPLPCDLHDACYATCGVTRALCDSAFLANMLAVCDDLGPDQAIWRDATRR